MNIRLLTAVGLVGTLGAHANAGYNFVDRQFGFSSAGAGVDFDFTEQNDGLNNSYLTADNAGALTMSDPDLVGSGSIQAGDVDWFSFSLQTDASLVFATGATLGSPYGLSLQMLDGDGNVLIGDAEMGPGSNSPLSIQEALLPQGTYYVGISGFDPDVLSGGLLDGMNAGSPHNFDFNYVLSLEALPVAVVPLPPAALAGLGLLLPLGIARRIKQSRA